MDTLHDLYCFPYKNKPCNSSLFAPPMSDSLSYINTFIYTVYVCSQSVKTAYVDIRLIFQSMSTFAGSLSEC